MTVDEFVEWSAEQSGDARYELYDGIPLRMMAPESFRHAEAKFAVTLVFRQAIMRAKLDCHACVDSVGIKIDAQNSRSPDVTVQCGPYDMDGHWLDSPIVLVEIVSPSNSLRDGEYKLIDYFRVPSVHHSLVIHPVERKVVHHRRGEGEEIATRILSEGAITLSPPGFSVEVAQLFGDTQPVV